VIFATNEHKILNRALTEAKAESRLLSFYYLNQVKNPGEILRDIATLGVFEQPSRKKERKINESSKKQGLI
jgi:hypothetical protein